MTDNKQPEERALDQVAGGVAPLKANLPEVTPSDPGEDLFTDLKNYLERVQQTITENQFLAIIYTTQSGHEISVTTMSLSRQSDLAILNGVDLVDQQDCLAFCNINSLELLVKVVDKQQEKKERRPLGFRQFVDRTPANKK